MEKISKCDQCGSPMLRDVRKESFTYKGKEIILDQPGWYCSNCDEAEFSLNDMGATDGPFIRFKQEVDFENHLRELIYGK